MSFADIVSRQSVPPLRIVDGHKHQHIHAQTNKIAQQTQKQDSSDPTNAGTCSDGNAAPPIPVQQLSVLAVTASAASYRTL